MLTPFADGHPLAGPIVHPGGRELRRLPRRPTRQKHWCREGARPVVETLKWLSED